MASPVIQWSNVNRELDWRGIESLDAEPYANKEPAKMESYQANSYPSTENSETSEYGSGSSSVTKNVDEEEERMIIIFKVADIENAISSEGAKKIGEGGFGEVFKCKLRGGVVAIKILKADGMHGAKQFRQEVMVLGELNHKHLVKLIGVCYDNRALVYEYVENGSVGDYVEENPASDMRKSPSELPWQLRTRIIYQMCVALNYVHSRPEPLVHGDLKPDNILLDGDMNVKLADFGMCRFLPPGTASKVFVKASTIGGTEDYIDPDYKETGILTPGCDVYSFGITILKILTGKHTATIYKKMRKAYRTETYMSLVDVEAGDWHVEVAKNLAYYGLVCCSSKKDRMNNMKEMESVLGNIVKLLEG